MNKPSVYEIVIKGHAGERLRARLDDFSIELLATGETRIVSAINDVAHLHGVINLLASMAVEIISISMPAGCATQTTRSQTNHQDEGTER